ncbi:uncharacterized protein LOC106877552 isoform X2 [Octopus bimaculoides]|uniref:Uncharacterized protein n=1 Tax=Octopus bimaculoides TaxID=37653 RepID=A0A0L8GEU0_OCTBM|nr:uncharacterized protein LOC106877552 isoform X2 [Octopus bimaculoides]XP_052831120.1 uncharacterized protein LOC106877552 isoform X2 [Octopus bimaculoides]|eukprot:XP_014781971.1 PREDICTED: uncharacterized protein LOC106877552 isoform X2 [Octopus bimaculoides]
MLEHRPAKIAVIVVTLIIFIVTAVLNAYASQPDSSSGIYTTETGNVSDFYPTRLTPASWTFGIWGFIYFWMILWLVYSTVAIFLKVGNEYLYTSVIFMPCLFFFIYSVNLLLNISWLILFDRKLFIVSLFVLLFMFISAVTCVCISCYVLTNNFDLINETKLSVHVWLIRFFVQNGIAFYAAWLLVATHLNLDIALRYSWEIDSDTCDLTAVIMLLVIICTWFLLDVIALDNYTRYLFSEYIVFIVAFCGVVYKQLNTDVYDRIDILILICLSASGAFFVFKMAILLWRHFRKSSYITY